MDVSLRYFGGSRTLKRPDFPIRGRILVRQVIRGSVVEIVMACFSWHAVWGWKVK